MAAKSNSYRLQYLDFLRGIAALIMLQGHVFHSFLRNDLRTGGAYVYSQFVGGMPPAIFLFLTGVTLSFLMDSSERKGLSPWARVLATLRRSSYLFFLAFAFRLQMVVFSGGFPSQWQQLFRVDILNCMGFAIAVMSLVALVGTTFQRFRFSAALGLAIALASPLVSQLDWSHLPSMLSSYIVPNYNFFSFFPWGAYLAFGVSAGSAIRLIKQEQIDRAMEWAAVAGLAIIMLCRYVDSLPYAIYSHSQFWLNSPLQVLIKLGVTLVLLALAFAWTRYGAKDGWSFVQQLGTTSLLVYWVHIELVYGRWLSFFKNSLTVGQTVLVALSIITLMVALSVARSNFGRIKESVLSRWATLQTRLPIGKLCGGERSSVGI